MMWFVRWRFKIRLTQKQLICLKSYENIVICGIMQKYGNGKYEKRNG